MKPPTAKKIPKELTIHDHTRIDEYHWLNQRENPEVLEYLEKENAYTKEMMKNTEELQEKLYDEITGRIKQTDMSVPYFRNGYYYYTRYEEGKEYPVYCRKKGSPGAPEEIMLNVNDMAAGYSYYNIAGLSVSNDNKLLSFGVDTLGRRKYIIHVKDLQTGKILDDKMFNTSGSSTWANDNKTLFYTSRHEQTLRSYKIFKHTLGSGINEDTEIYHEKDDTYDVHVYKSKSKKYIIIASSSTLSNEFRFLPADKPEGTFTLFSPREKEHEYWIFHFDDRFYILTNLDAKNFRLMVTTETSTNVSHWKEVIPHRENIYLQNLELFNKYMVLEERIDGLTGLRVINMISGNDHYIDFEEQVYETWISVNPEFESSKLRFGYSSLTTPNSTYDYNMDTRERELLKQQEVLGNFEPGNYYAERLFAVADDGKEIPVSIVYRKGMKKNGDNPLLLYGYGSYGHTMDPYFSSVRLSLLDRGFAYAIAHVRGGQIKGREWYDDGKLLNKKNTFTDFISCAEYLIKQKYTRPEKLFAMGGSAGGLLIGAVINMEPSLFKGVIAKVPFVDVVTTMLDESIPLTTGEYDEWGNPNEKEYYNYILSYSPYDNVKPKKYPNILVTAGLHDSQVQYWEPAKWIARLRENNKGDAMILLHTNMDFGHSGASGRFERYRETALDYAFLLKLPGKYE